MALTATESLDPYRLPTTARPQRYEGRLRPSLESASFSGPVVIDGVVDTGLDTRVR